jgi:hypothetical protein
VSQKNNLLLKNNTKKPKNNGENRTLLGLIFSNIQPFEFEQKLRVASYRHESANTGYTEYNLPKKFWVIKKI